jgi:hypothetical protein
MDCPRDRRVALRHSSRTGFPEGRFPNQHSLAQFLPPPQDFRLFPAPRILNLNFYLPNGAGDFNVSRTTGQEPVQLRNYKAYEEKTARGRGA